MTWSIVARDPTTGALGVAVATRSFAVGASCPHLRAGVGAVSTQSMTSRALGPAVLDQLAAGLAPDAAIAAALAIDGGRDLRQLNVVDAHGRTATWTGRHCVEWCGEGATANVSVAGNMLAGAAVVEATLAAYRDAASCDFAERLLRAMEAGETAGGDRRGRQSAAMQITTTEPFPDLDLRVDDHPAPLTELRRLVEVWRPYWQARQGWMPTRANPSGTADLDAIEADWRAQGLELRFRR